jgi:hypothetical protein
VQCKQQQQQQQPLRTLQLQQQKSTSGSLFFKVFWNCQYSRFKVAPEAMSFFSVVASKPQDDNNVNMQGCAVGYVIYFAVAQLPRIEANNTPSGVCLFRAVLSPRSPQASCGHRVCAMSSFCYDNNVNMQGCAVG